MKMKKRWIKVNNMSDIKAFLEHAMKVEGDVIVKKGIYVIDGKSVMGIFSLDVTSGFSVEYPAAATEFDEFIAQFEA